MNPFPLPRLLIDCFNAKLKVAIFSLTFLCTVLAIAAPVSIENCAYGNERIRPRAIALSPDKLWAATANRMAGSVSLVSISDRSLASETHVGTEPIDLLWLDQTTLVVSLHQEKSLCILKVKSNKLVPTQRIDLTAYPYALACAKKSNRLLVSLHHPDQIVAFDTNTWKITQQYSCGAYPRHLLVSPDEKWFTATSELPAAIQCFDLSSGETLSKQLLHQNAFNLGQPTFLTNNKIVLPATINRDFPLTASNISRGWVVNNRLVTFNVPHGKSLEQKQMNLDVRGHGVADLTATGVNSSQDQLVVLASGAQEALILKPQEISWPTSHPGDFAPNHLAEKPGVLKRIKLNGRPIDLAFLNDNQVIVANEFEDSLQLIDLNSAKLIATISLQNSSSKQSLSRHEFLIMQGERIFFDGKRSRDGWLSCHTCHYDGHTSGQVFDTLNDATYDTKKLTLSLHNVTETEPWTWHGWQPDITEALVKSLHDTMHGRDPVTREHALALTAYAETLRPISPYETTPEPLPEIIKQGYDLFKDKAGCSHCHQPPNFTAGQRFGVSRVESASLYHELNPPGLLGLSTRRRFLHHGRANSLKQVLKLYHRPEDTSGVSLTEKELEILIQFLSVL